MTPGQLARKAATVSGWTLASRILGLVRDRLWAGVAGGSPLLDAFLAAFQLPNLLRNLFGEGALSSAVIPRYAQLREKDPAAAERFAGAVVARLAVFLSFVALVAIAACVGVQVWVTPTSKWWLQAAIALPMLPFLVFICVTAVLSGLLNVRRHFWIAAATPVLLNGLMISTIWMSPEAEVWAAPYAVLAAGILMVIAHLWALHRTGGVPVASLAPSPEEQEMRRALIPTVIASGVQQINAFLDTQLAFFFALGAGPVQFLYFGNRLLQFPMALIGHGVTTVAYPELARRAAEGWAATAEQLRNAVRLQVFWLLPAALGLFTCAEPLVRTIYQTGSFGEEAVTRTVLVTRFYALSLIPLTVAKLLVRAFHAHRDQKLPLRISLATVAANLLLNLVLIRTPLQEAGLALSTAATGFAACAAYLYILHRRGAHDLIPWSAVLRPLLAALVMALTVEILLRWWPQPPGTGGRIAILRLGAAVALGGLLYLGLATAWWKKITARLVQSPP